MLNEVWVTVSGNVVEDPMQRETVGAPVKFRLASTPAYLRDGMWMDSDTNFFDVVCWERLGEHVKDCVRRGDPVLVHGRLTVRDWEGEKGRGRSVEINAKHVGFDLKRRKAMVERLPRRAALDEGREETQVTAVEAAEAVTEPAA